MVTKLANYRLERCHGTRRRISFRGGLLLALFFFLSLTLGAVCTAGASYFDTFGVDARGMALGNAMTAVSDGWASVYYNPAALALSQKIEFSIGVCYAIPEIQVTDASGVTEDLLRVPGKPGGLKSISGPSFGLVLPIQRLTPRTLPTPIAMGLGLFVPNQSFSTNVVVDQSYPFDVLFQGRNESLMLNWAISTRISPAFYLGVGLASQIRSGGDFRISDSGVEDSTDSSVRFGAPSVLVGILLRPTERIRAGFVYRQKNEILASWHAVVDTRISIPLGPNPSLILFDQQEIQRDYVTAFTPDTFSFGGAYKITEQMMVSAQVDWVRWSQYQGPWDTPLEYEFNDIVVPRVGFAYRATRRLTLRCGLYYEPTGVTGQSEGFYPIGNNQIVPSVGIGYDLQVPWELLFHPLQIDAFFQYHALLSKDFFRAIPVNPITENLDVTSSGSVYNMGLSLTFRF